MRNDDEKNREKNEKDEKNLSKKTLFKKINFFYKTMDT